MKVAMTIGNGTILLPKRAAATPKWRLVWISHTCALTSFSLHFTFTWCRRCLCDHWTQWLKIYKNCLIKKCQWKIEHSLILGERIITYEICFCMKRDASTVKNYHHVWILSLFPLFHFYFLYILKICYGRCKSPLFLFCFVWKWSFYGKLTPSQISL